MPKRISLYGDFNKLAVPSYLSTRNLIDKRNVVHRKAVYYLKNEQGTIGINHVVTEGKTHDSIWNVEFSDDVPQDVVNELSDIIEKSNENVRKKLGA